MSTIRTLQFTSGQVTERAGLNAAVPPPEGTITWIDVQGQTAEDMAVLGERFGLHPLAVEDCLHLDQRPKLEEYRDHLFIVLHLFCSTPAADGPAAVEPAELHIFLGHNQLLTLHEEPLPPLDQNWAHARDDAALGQRGPDFLLYLVADSLADSNFPVLDALSDHLQTLEESVLRHQEPTSLETIFKFKRTLVLMRRVLSPQRDVLSMLSKRGEPWISEKTSVYLRDVYDHLARICESIDAGRDLLGNALDAYLSLASNRTNEIMKRLTLLSAVFMPLTFITGFFGQNFQHLPYHSDGLMFAMVAACAVIPTAMVLIFKKSGWF